MTTLESKPLCYPCHFRADGVFCVDGYLFFSAVQSGDTLYRPVMVEGESVTCSACDGKGYLLTSEGKQLLTFLEKFGRPLLRDLVDEYLEEKNQ
jgi:hypothetical protein